MQEFFQGGGANLGYGQKRGGVEAYVRCYTLHLLGGARMTQGGGNAPPLIMVGVSNILHIQQFSPFLDQFSPWANTVS